MAFVTPRVHVDRDSAAALVPRYPGRGHHVQLGSGRRVVRPDLTEDAGPDPGSRDAGAALLHHRFGQPIDTPAADVPAMRSLQVPAAAHDDVQAGPARQFGQRVRVPAEVHRRRVDDASHVVRLEEPSSDSTQVHVRQVVVRAVRPRVPPRLTGYAAVEHLRVICDVAMLGHERPQVDMHVLMDERASEIVRVHRAQNRPGHRLAVAVMGSHRRCPSPRPSRPAPPSRTRSAWCDRRACSTPRGRRSDP